MSTPRTLRALTLTTLAATVAALAGCSAADPEPGSSAGTPSGTGSASGSTSTGTALADACGDLIDVQLPWWPGVDYAFLFQLIGPGGEIDTDDNTYTGEIGDTGVTLTLRSGGPAAGFQPAASLYYQDDSIDLVVDSEDNQVDFSGSLPTVSVFSYYDVYPTIFLWGNQDWDFRSLADIKASGQTILGYSGGSYLTALEAHGDIDAAQVDGSFDGSPSRFVAADGSIVQQDYITTAPYMFEHTTPEWNKPIKFLSLNSAYPIYGTTLQVRSDRLESYAPCLQELVPLVQQAAVDYALDPSSTNALLVDYTSKLPGVSVVLTDELLTAANAAQLKYGLVRNSADGTFGSFDTARVQQAVDLLAPAFTAAGHQIKADVTPDDLVTNEFLDPSIALPADVPVPENDLPDDVPGLD